MDFAAPPAEPLSDYEMASPGGTVWTLHKGSGKLGYEGVYKPYYAYPNKEQYYWYCTVPRPHAA